MILRTGWRCQHHGPSLLIVIDKLRFFFKDILHGLAINQTSDGEHFKRPIGVERGPNLASLVGEGNQEFQPIRLDDLPESPLAPHLLAIGVSHAVMEQAARLEI